MMSIVIACRHLSMHKHMHSDLMWMYLDEYYSIPSHFAASLKKKTNHRRTNINVVHILNSCVVLRRCIDKFSRVLGDRKMETRRITTANVNTDTRK